MLTGVFPSKHILPSQGRPRVSWLARGSPCATVLVLLSACVYMCEADVIITTLWKHDMCVRVCVRARPRPRGVNGSEEAHVFILLVSPEGRCAVASPSRRWGLQAAAVAETQDGFCTLLGLGRGQVCSAAGP